MHRRAFLKTLGLGAAGAALAGTGVSTAKAAPGKAKDSAELATLIDLSLCVGCGACADACREANAHKFPEPQKPFPEMIPAKRAKPEDWSDKKDVTDRLTPYNWLFVETISGKHNGEAFELNVPKRCMHCVNPPCANLCPFGAARKEDNGVVRIDDQICFGGAKCKNVCPWDIPQRQSGVGLYTKMMPRLAGNGVMYKCDRCYDRLAEGELPACIEACPMDVQTIGPRDEIIAEAHRLAKEMGGYIYGEHENGGTNTIYVSPVPFEALEAARDKKPGRPAMAPVEDVMADEGKFAAALVAAPLAGVAAGLIKGVSALKNDSETGGEADNG
jgi:Fe-S-cluster-containing dehydrogenase component